MSLLTRNGHWSAFATSFVPSQLPFRNRFQLLPCGVQIQLPR
jgi:hypothetical protein